MHHSDCIVPSKLLCSTLQSWLDHMITSKLLLHQLESLNMSSTIHVSDSEEDSPLTVCSYDFLNSTVNFSPSKPDCVPVPDISTDSGKSTVHNLVLINGVKLSEMQKENSMLREYVVMLEDSIEKGFSKLHSEIIELHYLICKLSNNLTFQSMCLLLY